ncbi:hypothetical protein [Nonomuraea harbinensis]|uniref:Uncharacterized protein n=1 Tax=Nonomuraea harbinensis TaxID=1286938 RepID=A0ABW1BPP3_9ACTN|nr:hypothetical protein [Nonomuraea harbinensis]
MRGRGDGVSGRCSAGSSADFAGRRQCSCRETAGRGSWAEARRIADILRKETIGRIQRLTGYGLGRPIQRHALETATLGARLLGWPGAHDLGPAGGPHHRQERQGAPQEHPA